MSDLVGNPEDRRSQDMATFVFHITENYLFETKISKVELSIKLKSRLSCFCLLYIDINSSSDLSKHCNYFFSTFFSQYITSIIIY